MRFISPISAYRIVAKHQEVELLASGLPRVLAPGFTCEFRQSGVTDWEYQRARETFSFRGAVTDEGGRPLDPTTRTSYFDTADISNPKLRDEVEQFLLTNAAHGHDFIMVEAPQDEPPWPNYAKVRQAKAIAEQVEILGLDVGNVVVYEKEHENRESVVSALEALAVAEPEESLVKA